MNRIIRKKNENYTIISNVFVRDNRISLKAKGLMALIMSLPPDWEFSIRGIVATVAEGKAAIYTAIKELRQYGYCDIVGCRDERGKMTGNDYIFYEESKLSNLESADNEVVNPRSENRDMDNIEPYTENRNMDELTPHTDYQHTDNRDMENRPQINKEDNKGKKEINKESDEYSFEKFWDLYDKKTGKGMCVKAYTRLSLTDKKEIFEYLPKYKQTTPNKKYRKNPLTFIHERAWEDELIFEEPKDNPIWKLTNNDPDKFKDGFSW